MRSNGPVSARSSKDATWSRARRIRDVVPGSRNHRNADVDGGQAQRPAGQLPGNLARAAANFQHRSARADRGIRENGIDDHGGIARRVASSSPATASKRPRRRSRLLRCTRVSPATTTACPAP
jgi:hypothetical protein